MRRIVIIWLVLSGQCIQDITATSRLSRIAETPQSPKGEKSREDSCPNDVCNTERYNNLCGCDDVCVIYGDCCPEHPLVQQTYQDHSTNSVKGNTERLNGASTGEVSLTDNNNILTSETDVGKIDHKSRIKNRTSDNIGITKGKASNTPINNEDGSIRNNNVAQKSLNANNNFQEFTQNVGDIPLDIGTGKDNDKNIFPGSSKLTDIAKIRTLPDPAIQCIEVYPSVFYFLLSRCPKTWTDEYVRQMCEANNGVIREYFLPVKVTGSDLSFKNAMCALCHGHHFIDMTYWSYAIQCRVKQPPTFQDIIAHLMDNVCGLKFTDVARRPCRPYRDIVCEEESNGLLSHEQIGRAYRCAMVASFPLMPDKINPRGTRYKNMDCVRCTNVSEEFIKLAYCATEYSSPDAQFISLSKLTDIRDREYSPKLMNSVENEIVCPGKGRVYVASDIQCKHLSCIKGYRYNSTDNQCYLTVFSSYGYEYRMEVRHHKTPQTNNSGSKEKAQDISNTGAHDVTKQIQLRHIEGPIKFYEVIHSKLSEMINSSFHKITIYNPWHNYAISRITTNCAEKTITFPQTELLASISEVIGKVANATKWPWFINMTTFNVSSEYKQMTSSNTRITIGENINATVRSHDAIMIHSRIQICGLRETTCPVVVIEKTSFYDGQQKVQPWTYGRDLKGLCLSEYTNVENAQREYRNKNLRRVMEAERWFNERNASAASDENVKFVGVVIAFGFLIGIVSL